MKNKELENLRSHIDELDEAISSLLEQRLETARAIGLAKGEDVVYDPVREHEVIRRLQKLHPGIEAGALAAIQREIISLCRSVQAPLQVACMGPGGSYSQQAAFLAMGRSVKTLFVRDPREALQAVENGDAGLAVVPVENTIEGVVYATLDGFSVSDQGLKVVLEVCLPIRHVLASRTGELRNIREVRSHPQALAQCRIWLDTHLPGIPRTSVSTTSAAAGMAADDEGLAAVCNELAAETNELPVLVRNIQDQPHNTTRFWVVGRQEAKAGPENKTSLLFAVAHTPGSLLAALEPLLQACLNLTFIQSRPMPGNPFEYVFFVDLEGHVQDKRVSGALERMRTRCFRLRILGSYPCGGQNL
ncbi:MAG: prephenate dehydratase [Thermovirgaceae bacterium]|nr:prephenate dehydratase [Thermovirgaceae bacterium]